MRARDFSRWGEPKEWANEYEFLLGDLHEGAHTIHTQGQCMDIYVRDRGSKVTFVTFHAATKKSMTSPIFSGEGFTEKIGVNLIALHDPATSMYDGIDLGWFLGTKPLGDLRTRLAPLVHHILRRLGTERTVLWGASGGGFAALHFSEVFPDSIVLTFNARILFPERSFATDRYAFRAWETTSHPERLAAARKVSSQDLSLRFLGPLPATTLLFQNDGDLAYYAPQHRKFIENNPSDPRLFERVEFTGDGHIPVSGRLLLDMVTPLSDLSLDATEAARAAGFSPASRPTTNGIPAVGTT